MSKTAGAQDPRPRKPRDPATQRGGRPAGILHEPYSELHERTLDEVAEQLGVLKSAVGHVEQRAIRVLWNRNEREAPGRVRLVRAMRGTA